MGTDTFIVLFSVAVNVAVVAFSYGKLSQKVTDLCTRMTKIETRMNSRKKRKEG